MGTTTNMALRYPEPTVLANTLHTQIKNLAEDVDAAAARKREVLGGVQLARDVTSGMTTSPSSSRYMRINTTMLATAGLMPRIHIVGKTSAYLGAFDGHLTLYLYNTSGGLLYEPRWKAFGVLPTGCWVSKDASNQMVIVLDNTAGWVYAEVSVTEVANTYGTMTTAHTTGWTVTNNADNTGLTAIAQAL